MRKLDIGVPMHKAFGMHTEVTVLDKPGAGGACHQYRVEPVPSDDPSIPMRAGFAHADFQDGPVRENGINGCNQEDLIAIVIDRLQHFQKGKWSCRENALALTKLEEALMWLNQRTFNRIQRGVEGTNKL